MCGGPLAIIAGAVGAVGSMVEAEGKARDARLRGEVAKMNAEVAHKTAETDVLLAELPTMSANLEEAKVRDVMHATLATEKAYYGSGNLDPSSGAPLLVAGVTAAQAEVDIGLIRVQGMLGRSERLAEAASAEASAATQRYQVVASKNEAHSAIMAGIFGAASSFLAGFAGGSGGGGGGTGTGTGTGFGTFTTAPTPSATSYTFKTDAARPHPWV